jgi:hypothetical protein
MSRFFALARVYLALQRAVSDYHCRLRPPTAAFLHDQRTARFECGDACAKRTDTLAYSTRRAGSLDYVVIDLGSDFAAVVETDRIFRSLVDRTVALESLRTRRRDNPSRRMNFTGMTRRCRASLSTNMSSPSEEALPNFSGLAAKPGGLAKGLAWCEDEAHGMFSRFSP